ncbi:T-complex protein 11 [Artemisia annua]|uniref:T-complex protein 11 n=1 Tax=Artemisia annua TaxID=35608 RepID=A0A2U1QHN9_ARTAN|nr:T-complex protein 11 [Artemisia annua]
MAPNQFPIGCLAFAYCAVQCDGSHGLLEKGTVIPVDTLSIVQGTFTAQSTTFGASCEVKRAAAEKKRLGLLKADMEKAHARLLQVRTVAKFVSQQREIERSRLRESLEEKLQRLSKCAAMQAKRQRAEYLMQRAKLHSSVGVYWTKKMQNQKRTTFDLAKSYSALNINEDQVKSMPFDQFAHLIGTPTTLQTTKALFDRLEIRYKAMIDTASSVNSMVKMTLSTSLNVLLYLLGGPHLEVGLALDMQINRHLQEWAPRPQLNYQDINFVVWKVKDAESLEEDLMTHEGDNADMTHDMRAIQIEVEVMVASWNNLCHHSSCCKIKDSKCLGDGNGY